MKYAKIINDITKQCDVGIGTDSTFYESIGMELYKVEQGYDGNWYLEGFAPVKPAELILEESIKEAKYIRSNTVSNITVVVDGMVFDGDEVSQERMARTITAAIATGESMSSSTTWVLHDNTIAKVSISQLAAALRLAGEEQTRLWTVPYEASYTPAEAA